MRMRIRESFLPLDPGARDGNNSDQQHWDEAVLNLNKVHKKIHQCREENLLAFTHLKSIDRALFLNFISYNKISTYCQHPQSKLVRKTGVVMYSRVPPPLIYLPMPNSVSSPGRERQKWTVSKISQCSMKIILQNDKRVKPRNYSTISRCLVLINIVIYRAL
jgi:hypothetical protein